MKDLCILVCLAAVLLSGCTTAMEVPPSIEKPAEPAYLVINEIASAGDYEFVELFNLSGFTLVFGDRWYIIDDPNSVSDEKQPLLIPEGTSIAPYGYLLLCPAKAEDIMDVLNDADLPPDALCDISFALSSHDSVSLYRGDLLVDTISWETDMNSYGRMTDGLSEFSADLVPTPGAKNVPEKRISGTPSLVINEVNSKGEDYVELINTQDVPLRIDEETWSLEDISRSKRSFLPGQEVQPGGILLIREASTREFSLKLGSSDTLTLRKGESIADRLSWSEHASSLSRVPDGTGSWMEAEPSPGEENARDQ